MNIHCLTEIPCSFDPAALGKSLHIRTNTPDAHDLNLLIAEAQAIVKPKALYHSIEIESRAPARVVFGGSTFRSSRILQVNLENAPIVYPFVITCGIELEDWAHRIDELIWSYWAEGIKEAALQAAYTAFQAHLEQTYHPGPTSTMSPGSLEDWPITQQRPLFDLFGDTESQIGVRLTPSMLMIPNKTVSGIVFERDHTFKSCQLCPRQNCPGRSAPYDETLYEREYCPAVEKPA